jgi:membrane protein implicated in regulation of membrane protease activity
VIVIVGLVVFSLALLVAIVGVLSNFGDAHPLAENFSVFGYHVTGSTGTLFLFGIVVGVVAMLGMSALLAGASRSARRGRTARRDLQRSQREVVNREAVAVAAVTAPGARVSLRDSWSRLRRPGAPDSLTQHSSADPGR